MQVTAAKKSFDQIDNAQKKKKEVLQLIHPSLSMKLLTLRSR
jgi:hypothetical protein